MKKMQIRLVSINDVKEFVNLASAQFFEVDLISGRYVIDAKSIMGIFSLDLSHPISVEIHADGAEADAFAEKLARFAVK